MQRLWQRGPAIPRHAMSSERQAEQKHLERAGKFVRGASKVAAHWCRSREHNCIDELAAQFAEVERERDAAWAKAIDPISVGTDYGALLRQGPEMAGGLLAEKHKLEVDERSAADQQLRAIVRAGDALRDALDEHTIKQGALLAVWDAATEGIDRETRG